MTDIHDYYDTPAASPHNHYADEDTEADYADADENAGIPCGSLTVPAIHRASSLPTGSGAESGDELVIDYIWDGVVRFDATASAIVTAPADSDAHGFSYDGFVVYTDVKPAEAVVWRVADRTVAHETDYEYGLWFDEAAATTARVEAADGTTIAHVATQDDDGSGGDQ